MTPDEEFVRSVWAEIDDRQAPDFIWIKRDWATFSCDGWASAAEFTRDRLEQIRQVESEIYYQREESQGDLERILEHVFFSEDDRMTLHENEQSFFIVECTRILCAGLRILARAQAALAELKRGLRK